MIHHISISVSNLERSTGFYDSILGAIGYVRVWKHEISEGFREAAAGYGIPGKDDVFAIRERSNGFEAPDNGFHVAFSAPSRAAVETFHHRAIEAGGEDNGSVGLHPEYGPGYFASFIIDPDGYRIEAVITDAGEPTAEGNGEGGNQAH